MLAPLSDLVGECGETKTTRKNKVKKKPWQWDSIHQEAFDNVKKTITKEVVLAYPDYTKPFGHLPSKNVIRTPWKALCVDLIGSYTLKGKDGSAIDFMALTMINPLLAGLK
jgi:hypothetical protein